MQIFEEARDYQAFERVLQETLADVPMRICAFCTMPSHWHMLCWPEKDGELARFMQRLTVTHVRRWQEHRHYVGLGHVYQGRYINIGPVPFSSTPVSTSSPSSP